MTDIQDFIKQIEQFADRHSLSDTSVSVMLTKSPGYLARLRAGRDTGSRRIQSLRQKMRAYDMKMGDKI